MTKRSEESRFTVQCRAVKTKRSPIREPLQKTTSLLPSLRAIATVLKLAGWPSLVDKTGRPPTMA